MKKHPKVLLTLFLMILGISSISAQGADTLKVDASEAKVEAITRRLERELGLTAKQALQVKKLVENRYIDLKKTSRADVSAKEAINSQSKQKLSAILTKDQYAQYLKLREANREQKQEFLKKHPDYTFTEEDKDLDF